MSCFRVLIGQLIALLICAPVLSGELYSTSNSGHKVNVLDPASGSVSEFASFEDSRSRGIAFEPNGKLYVTTNFDDHSTLEELDRSSGSRLHIGRFEDETFVQAIDFDYQGNFFALTTSGKLYRLDREVGADFKKKEESDVLDMVLVGETGVLDTTDIAIDIVGRLFAVTGRDLYQFDPFTAKQLAATKIVIQSSETLPTPEEDDIKSLQVSFNQVEEPTFAGLMFDGDGTLYATSNTCPTSLYQVDSESGNATFVSQTSMCDPCSGDFPPPEFVAAGIGDFWGGVSGGGNYSLGFSGGLGGGTFGGAGGIGGGYGGGGGNGTSNTQAPTNPNGPTNPTDPTDPGVAPVPEPGSFCVFGLGLAGLGIARMIQRRAKAESRSDSSS
ncbi:PEP-CTERM sorting domain-containing protein [Blastopirellula marina]|uniref:PEP-CTERM sorting domain-containing protein n=1 Tax=Blastopirellula marina TaxID=124 RepID=UPI001304D2A8|nr:PEP-CTERM sorting domain-containing protein [Blastopirellula marina]